MQVLIYYGYSKQGTLCPLEIHSAARWAVDIVDNDDNNQHNHDDNDDDVADDIVHTICLMGDFFFSHNACIIKFLIFISPRRDVINKY